MIPKSMSSYKDGTNVTWTVEAVGTCNLKYLAPSEESDTIGNINVTIPTKLGNNYVPKNNKLLTYPYFFFNLTNNVGITESFKYEDFIYENNNYSVAFWVSASITPGMSLKAIPLFYKNENINYNFGIIGGKLPICSYNSDVYLNWLRQNGLNSAFNLVSGVVGGGSSFGSANIGGVLTGISGIYNVIHERNLVANTPNQAKGNTNAGDINFSDTSCGLFTIYKMSIKDEYAKIIDNYFSMFGYKINLVKIPNIFGRQNWNYVKTIDCNFDGDIPAEHLSIIRNMFNSGITFWHSPNSIYNYDLDNNIV